MNRATCKAVGFLLVFAVSGVEAAATKSEEAYPNRPIRFIVPFAPGGPSDILSRLMGQKLGEAMGETVVVDNRGAVGGILGAELGSNAPPDGYTLLMAANSLLTINPHVYKKLPLIRRCFCRGPSSSSAGCRACFGSHPFGVPVR